MSGAEGERAGHTGRCRQGPCAALHSTGSGQESVDERAGIGSKPKSLGDGQISWGRDGIAADVGRFLTRDRPFQVEAEMARTFG
jgi:hypothetical protein